MISEQLEDALEIEVEERIREILSNDYAHLMDYFFTDYSDEDLKNAIEKVKNSNPAFKDGKFSMFISYLFWSMIQTGEIEPTLEIIPDNIDYDIPITTVKMTKDEAKCTHYDVLYFDLEGLTINGSSTLSSLIMRPQFPKGD